MHFSLHITFPFKKRKGARKICFFTVRSQFPSIGFVSAGFHGFRRNHGDLISREPERISAPDKFKVRTPCWAFSAFFQNIGGSFHILSGVKNPAPMVFSCSRYANGVLRLGRWLIAPVMRVCTRADCFFPYQVYHIFTKN